MPIALKSGKPVLKATEIATTCSCCSGTDCQCVRCRNGCSFYVSGEGYDTYDARCEAPSAPSGGRMLWIPPTAQSSPGISSFYDDNEAPLYVTDYIQLGKANNSSANTFFMSLGGGSPSLPFVWGTRYRYQGTNSATDYQWSAGFAITCQAPANSNIVSLVFDSYLFCLFGTGNNYSTTRRFGLVLQTASGNDCKAVSVQSEPIYNECLEPNVLGALFTWCRIEIPFPLSIQINGEGTALNGTLYPWNTPVLSSTPASVSFVVSKKDCCFQCDSGSTNVCCNPLP